MVYPTSPAENPNRHIDAVGSAIVDSAPGDIVIVEMQTAGPDGDVGAPQEYDPAAWSIIEAGVDAGVTIVAAAGNGAFDLDAPEFAEYRDRGDSGAIIVGAGDPETHAVLEFSTFGSRVDVQGWGHSVLTLGVGQNPEYGGDVTQSYGDFSGTSSATPLVASACVLLQEAAKKHLGEPLDPRDLRSLLVQTGTPQSGTTKIGPLPNLRSALTTLLPANRFDPPQIAISEPSGPVVVADPMVTVSIAVETSQLVDSVRLRIEGELQPAVDTEPPFVFEHVVVPTGTWEFVAEGTDLWGRVAVSEPRIFEVGPESVGGSSSGEPNGTGGVDDDTDGSPPDGGAPTPAADPMPSRPARGGDYAPGCGCRHGRRAPSAWWLLLLVGVRRRSRARTARAGGARDFARRIGGRLRGPDGRNLDGPQCG